MDTTVAGPVWEPTEDERALTGAVVGAVGLARRLRAAADALEVRALAVGAGVAREQTARAGAPSRYDFPFRSMASEVAAAAGESKQAMLSRMAHADVLAGFYPGTLRALGEGRITRTHAAVIREHGERLPDDERGVFEERMVAFSENASPGQARVFARQLVERLSPVSVRERHRAARERRGVWTQGLGDGMAELRVVAEAVTVHGAYDRLTQMGTAITRDNRRTGANAGLRTGTGVNVAGTDARAGADADGVGADAVADGADAVVGDTRTLAQVRADLAIDLLLAGAPSGHTLCTPDGAHQLAEIRGSVQVTIPARTLTGQGDDAAFLTGHGPIDPDTARRLAGHQPGWERLFHDPDTGALLTVDRYTPTPAQKRYLRARDETCRFPSCTNPALHADIDHTRPYSDGGITGIGNLACLCKGCHRDKHHTPWHVTHVAPGILQWTSPTGTTYTDTPAPRVRFTALHHDDTPPRQPPGTQAPGGDPPGDTTSADPPPF